MSYSTPGVYVREVDSGPKPIAAAATSVAAFYGHFPLPSSPSKRLVLRRGDGQLQLPVRDDGQPKDPSPLLKQLEARPQPMSSAVWFLRAHGHEPLIKESGEHTVVSAGRKRAKFDKALLAVDGTVLAQAEQIERELTAAFGVVEAPEPLALWRAFGGELGEQLSVERSAWSPAPGEVTNKSEFFRWLQRSFVTYLLDTDQLSASEPASVLVRKLDRNPEFKERFQSFLSQPSVFQFLAAVNGFYENGGGKAYVALHGVTDLNASLVEQPAARRGLHAFDDAEDIALMVAPGLARHQQVELLELCELRKDRFAILDGPAVSTGSVEIPASDAGYGAMYLPWVGVTAPSWLNELPSPELDPALAHRVVPAPAGVVYVPPSGHVAGLYARVDGERGVHKPPANEILRGVRGLSQRINHGEQGLYNERGVNVVRDLRDRGIRVWGARTLSTKSNPEWRYVNVRRLFLMMEQSIKTGSEWAVFEPNDPFLWSKLVRDIRAFLLRVWRTGALFGATPDQAFYVKCDAETNPRESIDAGEVHIQVGVSPVKPAEFVVFHIGQWDGGGLITE